MAFGSYEEGELLAVPRRHHQTIKVGASAALYLYVAARSHRTRKPGSSREREIRGRGAADVLAAYVSKMWSQARNSLALDGLEGTWNFRAKGYPESRRPKIGGGARRHPSMLSIGCALGVDADRKTSRRSTISRLQVDDLLVANVPVRKHSATRVKPEKSEPKKETGFGVPINTQKVTLFSNGVRVA